MNLFVFSSIALFLYINPFFSQTFSVFLYCTILPLFSSILSIVLHFICSILRAQSRTETDLRGYLSTHPPAFQYFYTRGIHT